MITTIIESVLIVILAVVAVTGLVLLGVGLKRRRLNPMPVEENHDHALCEVEPKKIHQLFEYKTK